MKYETPELKALTPAAEAIQGANHTSSKKVHCLCDTQVGQYNETVSAYADWE